MPRYNVYVPATHDLGDYVTTVTGSLLQTYRKEALQEYNNLRIRECLLPLARLPKGTTFTRVKKPKPALEALVDAKKQIEYLRDKLSLRELQFTAFTTTQCLAKLDKAIELLGGVK